MTDQYNKDYFAEVRCFLQVMQDYWLTTDHKHNSSNIVGFSLQGSASNHLSGNPYGITVILVIFLVIARSSCGPNLLAMPTAGSGTWFCTWFDGFKYLTNAVEVMQEGYAKYGAAPFKVAEFFHWRVIVSSPEHIKELARAPEEELSFVEGTNDRLNSRYTLGDDIHDNPYHLGAIRTCTRNLGILYPAIRDEIVTAFDDFLDLRDQGEVSASMMSRHAPTRKSEWKSIPALNFIRNVVCRTSNRLFVGLPLCRDPDWINVTIQYAINVGKVGYLLLLFPKFIRPLAVRFFTGIARGFARGLKHLSPIIEERVRDSEYGNVGVEKNDFLSWLMAEAQGVQLTPRSLTARILFLNVTAIHTSSNSFAHALFYLANNPQFIQPLREEVESVVEREGWSKASVSKMRKVDSFLKECQRVQGLDAMTILRKALKDYTFKDGTFIPKGTLVGVASQALRYEGKFYEDPSAFRPFRFIDTDEEDNDYVKGQFVSTATKYLSFGYGKHACPGRIFAANVLKTMLTHVVVTYDVKLEDNATRPHSLRFGTLILPDSYAKVLFRKRAE